MKLPILSSLSNSDRKWVYALIGLFILLLAVDVGTTTWALILGAWEANPYMAPYVSNLPLFIGLKVFQVSVLVAAVEIFDRYAVRGSRYIFYGVAIVVAFGPVVNNVLVILALS